MIYLLVGIVFDDLVNEAYIGGLLSWLIIVFKLCNTIGKVL